MLEPITTKLVASEIAKGGSIAAGKARDILRRERFTDEVDDLTTEFTSALKASLKTAIGEADRDDIADLEANWTTIAEELEGLTVGFADVQEAIVEITDAIAAGLEIDLDANPQLRESLETG